VVPVPVSVDVFERRGVVDGKYYEETLAYNRTSSNPVTFPLANKTLLQIYAE
jgi:hypothetical protein